MAEGLARHLFGDRAEIASAGSQPTQINPFAVAAMNECGIDITQHYSKPITEVLDDYTDLVITLCVDEVCPVVTTDTKQIHWLQPNGFQRRTLKIKT